MSRRAPSLKGDGKGVERPTPKQPGPAAPVTNAVVVEGCDAWGELLAGLRDARFTPWRADSPVGGAAPGAPLGLLYRVSVGGQPAGFIFARQRASTTFEIVPLLPVTGADAVRAGELCLRRLFLDGPATSVFLAHTDGHAEAASFSRGCGLQPAGQRRGVTFARLDVLAWLEAHRDEFRAEGEAFRLLVFPEDAATDPLRDSILGVCLALARRQPDKALAAYDGFALVFGLDSVEPVTVTPELVAWRQRGAVIALNRITGGLTLLHHA